SPEEPDAGPAAAHTAVVPAVVGPIEVRAGDTVAVVSTPETCTPGGAYPDGDPLDPATGLAAPDGTVIVLLSTASDEPDVVDGGGVLHLVTPYQGVVAPDEDGALPATWPSPSSHLAEPWDGGPWPPRPRPCLGPGWVRR